MTLLEMVSWACGPIAARELGNRERARNVEREANISIILDEGHPRQNGE